MTKRLAMTPAVGLFAGLSVVSYGAVSMLLTGVHGTRQAATNPCVSSAPNRPAPTATAGTQLGNRPGTRTASHVSGRAQHPAGMPVLLAHAVRLAPAQTTPLSSTQPSPSASAPALPQPSPQSSAAPSTTLPQPAPPRSRCRHHLASCRRRSRSACRRGDPPARWAGSTPGSMSRCRPDSRRPTGVIATSR